MFRGWARRGSLAIVLVGGRAPVFVLTAVALLWGGATVSGQQAGVAGETHHFEPTRYYNTFSFAHEPVLTIQPGDRVVTKTIDARGRDETDTQVASPPNPNVGPFYIEGAEPGDVLVVQIGRIEPNRDTAWSFNVLAPYAVDPDFLRSENATRGRDVETWSVDADRGVARPTSDSVRPRGFEVPLRPMLGCVAVAPPRKEAVPTSTPGEFGGNMDYKGGRRRRDAHAPGLGARRLAVHRRWTRRTRRGRGGRNRPGNLDERRVLRRRDQEQANSVAVSRERRVHHGARECPPSPPARCSTPRPSFSGG